MIKLNLPSLSQKFGWGRDREGLVPRARLKGGSRNLDGADTSDDAEIKWDKETVASTTIGFVKLHFPYISCHLSLESCGQNKKYKREKKC